MMRVRQIWIGGAVLAAVGLLYLAGAWATYRLAVPRLAERGAATMTLLSDRLVGQLEVYRYLPSVLARHPDVVAALQDGRDVGPVLRQISDVSGALQIFVMNRAGKAIAASNWDQRESIVGQNLAWRPYFQRAMDGALGFYHAVGVPTGQRGFYFAHPVWDGEGDALGVIAVTVDLERIESAWRGVPEVAFFHDDRGVIFLTNRNLLVLRALGPVAEGDAQQYGALVPEPLPGMPEAGSGTDRVWTDVLDSELPDTALWLQKPLPALGLTANVLVDTRPAREVAALGGALAAAVGAVLMMIGGVLVLRRNALRRMLDIEARATQRLEGEVIRRTAELSDTNAQLRGEVAERQAAETALRQVQAELVQAGKLKALGEMSAGISHELNQPLAAIQSLADNGEVLLERGRTDEAQDVLARIGQLSGRMGRIIRNLRAFARKEGEAVGEVDLVAAVNDALSIAERRLRTSDTAVEWAGDTPVMVKGGRVRLQQVVLNLLSNAVDAMEEQDEKRVSIRIEEAGPLVRLYVRDTGPGLADGAEVFDPFHTTKPVGKGTGLGLSISYGIVQSFGGKISGETAAEGGAVFTVELAAARAEMAAE